MSAASKKRWRADKANRARELVRERAARGPSGHKGERKDHYVPAGHVLAGVSTLHDADGNVSLEWDKSARDGVPALPPPPDFSLKGMSRLRRGGSEVLVWESFDRDKADRHQALMAAWERCAEKVPAVRAVPAPETAADHQTCSVYVVGDHHLGMLAWWRETGESWDLQHGIDYLLAAHGELVSRMPSSERAVIINVGDFKHSPNGLNRTPGHGNPLDVDGRNAKVDDAACMLLVGAIDHALQKHRHVTVYNLPGNHDPEVAAALARVLRAWYRNEPRVTIADAYRQHQYFQFGMNLIGMHHGDSTPANELPGIMAVDCGLDGTGIAGGWGNTRFHSWICGHVHHKIKHLQSKEFQSVLVEYFNILPPGDAWHVGRYRAQRYMTGLILDRDYGEVGRCQVGIEKVRALLAAGGQK